VLFHGAMVPVVQDVNSDSSVEEPPFGIALLRLSRSCVGAGRALRFRPSECASLLSTVRDPDGKLIAVAMQAKERGCSFRMYADDVQRLRVRVS